MNMKKTKISKKIVLKITMSMTTSECHIQVFRSSEHMVTRLTADSPIFEFSTKQKSGAGSNPSRLLPFSLLTMAAPSASDPQRYVFTHLATRLKLTIPHSTLMLTTQENAEINDRARWLHRAVNPFMDFYVIMAVSTAGSPTATEAAQGHEDRQPRDHAKDL